MNIKFSLVAPAIRKDKYISFYESIKSKNNSSFEIVFAGPEPPDKKMPDNFKYIVTHANPAWAAEIAVRYSEGDYIVPCCDDGIFSDGYLDRIDYYSNKMFMEKSLIGGRFKCAANGDIFLDNFLVIDGTFENSPLALMTPAFKRDVWNEIGGIDNRFVSVFWDLDMQMRFYEIGYIPFIMPDAFLTELIDTSIKSDLLKTTWEFSRKLINKFWIGKEGMSRHRLLPVYPINDDNIRTAVERVI